MTRTERLAKRSRQGVVMVVESLEDSRTARNARPYDMTVEQRDHYLKFIDD